MRVEEMKPIQTIPLNQIDLSDDTFSVNFMPDLKNLRSSIQTAGLIQPVLLRKKKDSYQIVCGFRRVVILKGLGILGIPAMIYEGKERKDLGLFTLALQENLTTRGFNTIEIAVALNKLIHSFMVERSEVIKSYLPLFPLEPNEKILDTYLSLARMEDEIKVYVLQGEVSRSNIRLLAKICSEDRIALSPFLSILKLGENRLREVLTLLSEISRRERVSIKEIINHPEIEAIVSLSELTPIQRTERVKRALMALRHPKMRQMEEEFEKKRRALHLAPAVSLQHPPYFEGKELKMEFQFRTMEEYRAIVDSLSRLAGKEEFKELIGESQIRSGLNSKH
jgi:ParB/RepB/Spo0J family partition protein